MLLLDLFCGKGGWSVAALRRGWTAVGIDCQQQPRYPGRQILTRLPIRVDALINTYHPDAIAASPPCDAYARHHLPWIKGDPPDTGLMAWSLSLIDDAPCPVIVECSRFAAWHFPGSSRCGSLYLWGAVPTLLPTPRPHKMNTAGQNPGQRAFIPPEAADWIIESIETRILRTASRSAELAATRP